MGLKRRSSTSRRRGTAPRLRFFRCADSRRTRCGLPDWRSAQERVAHSLLCATTRDEFGIPYYWNIAPEYDATFAGHHAEARRAAEERALSQPPLRRRSIPPTNRVRLARKGISATQPAMYTFGGAVDPNRVSDDFYFVDLFASGRCRSATFSGRARRAGLGKINRAPYTLQRVQQYQTLQDPAAWCRRAYVCPARFGMTATCVESSTRHCRPVCLTAHDTLVEEARHARATRRIIFRLRHWILSSGGPECARFYAPDRAAPANPQAYSSAIAGATWTAASSSSAARRATARDRRRASSRPVVYVYVPYRNRIPIPIASMPRSRSCFSQLFYATLRRRRPVRRRQPTAPHFAHPECQWPGDAARPIG